MARVAMPAGRDVGPIRGGKFADLIAANGGVLRPIDLLQRVDIAIKHGAGVK